MKEIRQRSAVRPFVQILTILLLLALLCAMLITELSRAKGTYSCEQARLTSYIHCDTLAGYIFRNETALRSNNNGPITYFASDGEHMSAGSVVAEVYIDDTATDKREQAAALQQQLQLCEIALAEADEQPWQSHYMTDYRSLMAALGTASLSQATQSANNVATALALRDAALPETAEALRAEIASLQAQLDALVAYVDAPQSIPADTDGYFYREADGYEALFGASAAKELSPEGLEALLASPASTGDCIGKLVRDGEWYLALPTEAVLAATYTVGQTYTVHFESVAGVTMVLEQINPDATGEGALLLLCGERLPEGLDSCRRQSVRIEKATVQGLSVPALAINEDGCVFVNENGIVRKRLLAPVDDTAPFLSQPCEDEGYLKEGERILVSTRSLYDGKVLE